MNQCFLKFYNKSIVVYHFNIKTASTLVKQLTLWLMRKSWTFRHYLIKKNNRLLKSSFPSCLLCLIRVFSAWEALFSGTKTRPFRQCPFDRGSHVYIPSGDALCLLSEELWSTSSPIKFSKCWFLCSVNGWGWGGCSGLYGMSCY